MDIDSLWLEIAGVDSAIFLLTWLDQRGVVRSISSIPPPALFYKYIRMHSRQELERTYHKLVEPNFHVDERMPIKEFCDYFISDKYRDRHFIEFNDDYLLLWCDLPGDVKCIEFLVVDKDKRNGGLGRKVFSEWMDRHGHPKLMMEIDNDGAERFWGRFGIHVIPGYDYVQPPLKEGLNPVYTLKLATNFTQTKDEIDKMVKNWFKYGFGLE